MRPSFEALPSWLSRLPEVPPPPLRPGPPPEDGVLRRALGNVRLSLHVAVLAVVVGLAAAVAAGSARARHAAAAAEREEMSAFAQRKAVELRALTILRGGSTNAAPWALAPGGSLADDVAGYSDVVQGTAGYYYRRRWTVQRDEGGAHRVAVRVIPETRADGPPPVEVTTAFPVR